MSGEPSREAVDEVKTEIDVIKRKCEQYWNERGIEDPEIHAILGFIHQRADGIARALDAERARVWEEAARLLHLQADDMGKGHENARMELMWQADRFRARAAEERTGV